DAIIVDETADLDAATEGILISAYGFQGQKCSAASRLIVTEMAFAPLLERVLARSERLVVGPAEENPDLGPVASKAQEEKVLSYIEVGKGEGQLVLGGKRLEGEGYFIAPTIFT
ncbi:aldehyde dehydrogenase family protein, partial [Shewanella sp. C31]|nr:aldehyde dehydrogenase family protein [Shewanella electrica]